MALQKQLVNVALRGGLDTKTDPSAVVPGKLLVCENATFVAPGRLQKRPGSARLEGRDSLPDDFEARSLGLLKDELLLAGDLPASGGKLYGHSAAASAWTDRGTLFSVAVEQHEIARSAGSLTGVDGIVHPQGLRIYVWEDSTLSGGAPTIGYTVIDADTDSVLIPPTRIGNGIKPRVLAFGNRIVFIWYSTSAKRLYYSTTTIAAPGTLSSPVALTGTGADENSINDTLPNYDAAVLDTEGGERLYLVFVNRVAPNASVSVWVFEQTNLSVPFNKTLFDDIVPTGPVTVFGYFSDGAGSTAYYDGPQVAGNSAEGIYWRTYDPLLYTEGALDGLSDEDTIVSITGACVRRGDGTKATEIRYSIYATSTYYYLTRGFDSTLRGRGLALAGKAFAYDGRVYFPCVHESPLQSTYFLLDEDGNVVAKLKQGQAGGIPVRPETPALGNAMLTQTDAVSSDTWHWPLLSREALSSVGGAVVFTQTGVSCVILDFNDPVRSHTSAQLGNGLHVNGGFLSLYDGIRVVEHGFHLFPEPISASAGASGGVLSDGRYEWVACYEWTDAAGQIHRSAPSIPVAVTLAGGTSVQKVSVTIPYLRITAKYNASGEDTTLVALYRTKANGEIFYRVGTVVNNSASDAVVYQDSSVTDTVLEGNPQLYTEGGVYENIAPGPVADLAVWGNRLWALDAANPLVLWYSKECVPGAPVEFSDAFTLNVDPRGGDIVAIEGMDDKLVVFKESSIFYVMGVGPSSNGATGGWLEAQLATTDAGCINARSIGVVPQGLVFDSRKGRYLLGRDMTVTYIGAEVERYNAETITSTQLIPTLNQVRFTLDSDPARVLVWDYFVGQWSVFTPIAAIDSVIWQGVWTWLRADGEVFTETPGVYSDDGAWIKLRAQTSWLQYAGPQGFKRVWKALLLGDYIGKHRLRVAFSFDHKDIETQVVNLTPTDPTLYGDGDTFGDDDVYGGGNAPYQYRIFPCPQKCEAIRLTIEDSQDPDSDEPNEGFRLSNIALEIGLMPGAVRLPASRSTG